MIVVKGGLAHQDDLGNGSVIRPGQIQLMSAGRGITYSELNASDREDVHFWEFWIQPKERNLRPSYQEKKFSPSIQHNQWSLIISHDGREGSLHIHQDADISLATLEEGKELNYELKENRFGWIQLLNGTLSVNGELLETGDGIMAAQSLHYI